MYETIYLLTNPYMPNLVKIGRTRNLEKRVKDLSAQTGIPVPFEVYYACKVEDAQKVERRIHDAFRDNRINSKREFFEIDPERVFSILDLLEVKDVTPDEDIVADSEDQETLNRVRNNSQYFSFELAEVPIGSILTFVKDHNFIATVVDNNNIEFEGETTSLTAATKKIFKREYGKNLNAVSGPSYWKFNNEKLTDRKIRLEILKTASVQNEDFEDLDLIEKTLHRGKFTFELADVPIGSVLTFLKDDKFKATVVNNTKIEFEGEITSLTGATKKIFKREYGKNLNAVSGPSYWKFNDEKLTDRRYRIESKSPTNNRKKDVEDHEKIEENLSRERFTFEIADVPIGSILTFVKDDKFNATVVNNTKIEFEGEITSLTGATKKIFKREYGKNLNAVSGPNYWKFNNEKLTDRRNRIESPDSVSSNSTGIEISQATKIESQNRGQDYFNQLNILVGSILNFKLNKKITATVVNGKKIEFEGEITSLSKAAKKVLHRDFDINWKSVQGTRFWTYRGETLADRKDRFEKN